ncbi:MAG TPA: PAS domain S-box protein [Desulfuromonadales bacterium]
MNRICRGGSDSSRDRLAPLKVALYYALAAGTWILLSDRILEFIVRDANQLTRLQTAKGGLFVLVSALFLYILARKYLRVVHRREALLMESEERFRSVFQTAAAGMVIMHPDGRIFQANPAFCRFTGFSEEELLQMTIADVTHPEDRDRTREQYLNLAVGRNEIIHYEKRYLTRDGRTVWGHASVACLLGRENAPAYCIGLVQDITDRKRAEEELRETNRELDAFVYTVSHDLRSPLTPIIGFAGFLRHHCRERLDAETDGILAEIEGQGRKMLALLEDLLCLAKVGKLERPLEPTDTREVLRQSLADLAAGIKESGTEIRIIEPLPPIGVPETLLAQIFRNLIGNALQYAGKQGGTVEVGGERLLERVRFFVRDHGPGVPPVERERIFDLFYRGSTGKHLKGTGIGLAIVQKIARLYQGGVWMEETTGGGATFWVEMIDEHSPMQADGRVGVETEKAGFAAPSAAE